jgi:hypothetical protein
MTKTLNAKRSSQQNWKVEWDMCYVRIIDFKKNDRAIDYLTIIILVEIFKCMIEFMTSIPIIKEKND